MNKLVVASTVAILMYSAMGFADDAAEAAPEPLWSGNAGLSYVSTTGNTETSSLGLDASLVRKPTPWGYELFATFDRAETSDVLTAERYRAGFRATRNLNDHWSVFAGLSGEKDEFAGIDFRTVAEAGATYTAIDTERVSLRFDGGLTHTDEDRLPPEEDVSFLGGLAAAHLAWTISETATLTEDLTYFPNFDDSADWRLASITALEASLTDLFALRFSYEYRFRNEPIGDNDDTDTTTKASLVLKF